MRGVSSNQKGSAKVTVQTLRYYWAATKRHWPWFLGAVLSSLGFVFFLSYMNPYLMGLVVDRVSDRSTAANQVMAVFGPIIVALVVVNALGQVCSKLQDYFTAKIEILTTYDLTTQAFDTLSCQSMTFYANRFGGSLVSQVQRFCGAYSTLMDCVQYAVIPICSSVIFTIALLAAQVPVYVAVLSIFLVIYVVVVYKLYSKILPANAKAAAAGNRLSGQLADSITNILAVKTTGREDFERARFDKASQEVRSADSERMRANIRCGAATSSIIVLIMSACTIFVAGGNAWFGVTPGVLVMMFNYTYSLTMQFNRLSSTFSTLNRSFGDAYDLTVALGEPLLVADKPNAPDLQVDGGALEFKDVSFHYPDAQDNERVFEGLNFSVPAGQRVGLVGRSGSGKTTLTTLLLRLADLQAGEILVDGQNIADAAQKSLRRSIAYVPQEPLLFHRSIRDNIAYGRPEATEQEIIEAAKKANALEFIQQLPQGFDTMVGERGVKLSGGQRQRVAIARAILADAPILVLDEATSALDSESERLIQEALASLMEGRTAIVIAHRLSTVASLDRIVVLQDGAIVEDGTHSQLVTAGGPYEKLWDRQTGAFLDEKGDD